MTENTVNSGAGDRNRTYDPIITNAIWPHRSGDGRLGSGPERPPAVPSGHTDRTETGTERTETAYGRTSRVVRIKAMPDGGVLFREDGAHFILYRSDLPALAAAFDDGSSGGVSP